MEEQTKPPQLPQSVDLIDRTLKAMVSPNVSRKQGFSPYLICACGCSQDIDPNRAFWFGAEPYRNRNHCYEVYREDNDRG